MTAVNDAGFDVFLSYAREERTTAALLAERLEAQGYRLWWDIELSAGQQFHTEILDKINTSRHVVVLWSPDSIESSFVLDEASRAQQQGKLIPVSLDNTPPPLGFGALHTISIQRHQPDTRELLRALGHPDTTGGIKTRSENASSGHEGPGVSRSVRRTLTGAGFALALIGGIGLLGSKAGWLTSSGSEPYKQGTEVGPAAKELAGATSTEESSKTDQHPDSIESADLLYDGPAIKLDADYHNKFSAFLTEHGLRRVYAGDLLTLSKADTFGECRGKNHVPPRDLWPNIIPLAKMLEVLRTEGNVTVVSAYRSSDFNTCIGGAPKSHHLVFMALDLKIDGSDLESLAWRVRSLRDEGLFQGGIAIHEESLHVDSRALNIDW